MTSEHAASLSCWVKQGAEALTTHSTHSSAWKSLNLPLVLLISPYCAHSPQGSTDRGGTGRQVEGVGHLFFFRSAGFSEFLGPIHISGPDMSRTAVSLPPPLPYRPLHHFLQDSEAPARPVSNASLVREGSSIRLPPVPTAGSLSPGPKPQPLAASALDDDRKVPS